MKTHRFIFLLAAFGLAAFPTVGGAEQAKTPKVAEPTGAPAPASPTPAVPSADWRSLKDLTYDQRALLLGGLQGLATRVDEQISELAAKRVGLVASNTSTKAWDFAMQELGNARTNLISNSDDLTKANRETWDQLKDKVGLAWVWTQDAYTKVKSSTTK